ncbi:unnamed protein product [Vitrella brassicaformis CCMP3155]|uniref:USP domain-containing protein n=4 Tax=Vitrella brassicaformis TaxID=1169539 RepID=A0A0G4GKG5_VITBC|nr:unnamed protein product [Vitrella brassicaformis CCMP3155]|eukprot:CEM30520.1 unnamed protein product [Vitrella brassicaformis CCMP3155]
MPLQHSNPTGSAGQQSPTNQTGRDDAANDSSDAGVFARPSPDGHDVVAATPTSSGQHESTMEAADEAAQPASEQRQAEPAEKPFLEAVRGVISAILLPSGQANPTQTDLLWRLLLLSLVPNEARRPPIMAPSHLSRQRNTRFDDVFAFIISHLHQQPRQTVRLLTSLHAIEALRHPLETFLLEEHPITQPPPSEAASSQSPLPTSAESSTSAAASANAASSLPVPGESNKVASFTFSGSSSGHAPPRKHAGASSGPATVTRLEHCLTVGASAAGIAAFCGFLQVLFDGWAGEGKRWPLLACCLVVSKVLSGRRFSLSVSEVAELGVERALLQLLAVYPYVWSYNHSHDIHTGAPATAASQAFVGAWRVYLNANHRVIFTLRHLLIRCMDALASPLPHPSRRDALADATSIRRLALRICVDVDRHLFPPNHRSPFPAPQNDDSRPPLPPTPPTESLLTSSQALPQSTPLSVMWSTVDRLMHGDHSHTAATPPASAPFLATYPQGHPSPALLAVLSMALAKAEQESGNSDGQAGCGKAAAYALCQQVILMGGAGKPAGDEGRAHTEGLFVKLTGLWVVLARCYTSSLFNRDLEPLAADCPWPVTPSLRLFLSSFMRLCLEADLSALSVAGVLSLLATSCAPPGYVYRARGEVLAYRGWHADAEEDRPADRIGMGGGVCGLERDVDAGRLRELMDDLVAMLRDKMPLSLAVRKGLQHVLTPETSPFAAALSRNPHLACLLSPTTSNTTQAPDTTNGASTDSDTHMAACDEDGGGAETDEESISWYSDEETDTDDNEAMAPATPPPAPVAPTLPRKRRKMHNGTPLRCYKSNNSSPHIHKTATSSRAANPGADADGGGGGGAPPLPVVNLPGRAGGSKFIGLQNVGNTCYLASFLQALFLTEPFTARLFKDINQRGRGRGGGVAGVGLGVGVGEAGRHMDMGLESLLGYLFGGLHLSTRLYLNPRMIAERTPFGVGLQQDVTELARWMWDALGGAGNHLISTQSSPSSTAITQPPVPHPPPRPLSPSRTPAGGSSASSSHSQAPPPAPTAEAGASSSHARKKCAVDSCFSGRLLCITKCSRPTCGHVHVRTETFYDIGLPVDPHPPHPPPSFSFPPAPSPSSNGGPGPGQGQPPGGQYDKTGGGGDGGVSGSGGGMKPVLPQGATGGFTGPAPAGSGIGVDVGMGVGVGVGVGMEDIEAVGAPRHGKSRGSQASFFPGSQQPRHIPFFGLKGGENPAGHSRGVPPAGHPSLVPPPSEYSIVVHPPSTANAATDTSSLPANNNAAPGAASSSSGSSGGDRQASMLVSDLLDRFLSCELLSDYKCDGCGEKGVCNRQYFVIEKPKHLILILNRFEFDRRTSLQHKKSTRVTVERKLNLPLHTQAQPPMPSPSTTAPPPTLALQHHQIIHAPNIKGAIPSGPPVLPPAPSACQSQMSATAGLASEGSAPYALYSVVVHQGATPYSGHYFNIGSTTRAVLRGEESDSRRADAIMSGVGSSGADALQQQKGDGKDAAGEDWYEFNDSVVSKFDVDKLNERVNGYATAYMLFYTLVEQPTPPTLPLLIPRPIYHHVLWDNLMAAMGDPPLLPEGFVASHTQAAGGQAGGDKSGKGGGGGGRSTTVDRPVSIIDTSGPSQIF